MDFPNRGFYRGDVNKLFADAMRIFNSFPPEEQVRISAELQSQESLVEGTNAVPFEGNDPPRAIDQTLTQSEEAHDGNPAGL